LFMVSTCCWCGRLCFGRGRDRGFVLYISLFLQVLGWCVCVCLYTRIHTHKLLGYLMWAQVWDGHLESQTNPDRLKRIIHIDRVGVHSTFVYIYAVLRVLMIWANCFFLSHIFSFEKSRRCDDNQQITVSHFGEHKRLHLESSKQNYYIISLRAIIKSIFTSHEVPCPMKRFRHMKDVHLPWNERRKRVQFPWICTGLVTLRSLTITRWAPKVHCIMVKTQYRHCEQSFGTNVFVLDKQRDNFLTPSNLLTWKGHQTKTSWQNKFQTRKPCSRTQTSQREHSSCSNYNLRLGISLSIRDNTMISLIENK